MDVDQVIIKKQCYKFDEQLIDNVNILQNKYNNFVIFWNKYQIILYEDTNFQKASKIIIPEYKIQCLLLSNKYLISLDSNHNIHVTSLKFKKVSQRYFKSTFQPRDTGVLAIVQLSTDNIVSLKMRENSHFLSVYNLNQDFYLEKRAMLLCKEPKATHSQSENCMMYAYTIKNITKQLQEVFNLEVSSISYTLMLISFDRRNIYACMLSVSMDCEEVSLVKLYSCPSKICNIEIFESQDLYIYVGLTIGTIIKLYLTEPLKKTDVIHLNTALTKFVIYKENILYTDSQTMWKAENLQSDLKLKQFFVRNIKDFLCLDEVIICTTYSKFIYIFALTEDSFLKLQYEEYCPAEIVFNDSEYLQKIMKEVDKSEQLSKRIYEEETHLTALALANRLNLIEEIIQSKVVAYNSYLDAVKGNTDSILVENIPNYFGKDLKILLINVTLSTIQHKLNKLVLNIFDNSRLLITLISEAKTVKSVSIKMDSTKHNFKCLIPVEDSEDNINVSLSIVTDVPGVYDDKTNLVTVLYKKDLNVTSNQSLQN